MLHRVDVEQTPDCVTPEPSRIFRVHVPRRQFDPWSVLDGPAATDAPVFAWSDGRSGLRFAAVGEVASWDLDGADRFDVAGQLVSRLRELLCDADVPSDLPLVHAGFSFSGTAGAGPWDGWPAARICLPRVLAWGCEGRGGVVVAGHANGEEADAAVVDRLRHLAAVSLRCATGVAAAPPRAVDRVAVDRATWCRNVVAATDDIGRGALDKVVLARSAFVAAQSAAPPLLRALAAANVGAYAFCVGSPRLGYFLGATPETLARVERGSVETVALAGTCPRGATAAEDVALGRALAASGKDQREHAITTGAIRAALEPVCEELYVAATPSLVMLPHVYHLETPILGRLRSGVGALEVCARLHPTPAVGGWPRDEALAWLRGNEPLDRGWYAGPIGWLGKDGDGVFAVAIRSALLREGGAHLFAGAGIVAGSDPEREWEETALKLLTARDVFADEMEAGP